MIPTRWPVVVDALLTHLQEHPDLTGHVFDGEPVTRDYIDAGVFVGVVLDEATGDAGTIAQQVHEMGGVPPRDEEGMVRCMVATARGDTDMHAARTRCFQMLGAAESVIRTHPDLAVDGLLWIGSTTAAPRQYQSENGARCEVEWRVTYRALI